MVYLVLKSQKVRGRSNASFKNMGILQAKTKKQAEKKLAMRVKSNPDYKTGSYILVKSFVDVYVYKKGKEIMTQMR
tara:strand:+ start:738 stop:965 length:228 start_codon:yes stop_codon:yes gene_type:complete